MLRLSGPWQYALVGILALANGLLQVWAGGIMGAPDEYHYACVARSLAEEGRSEAGSLRYCQIAEAGKAGRPITATTPLPVEYTRLGWPLVLAALYRLLGPVDWVYSAANVALYVVLLLSVFWLGCLTANPAGAWWGVALVLMSGAVNQWAFHSGLEMPYCTFIVLGAALATWNPGPWVATVAGACTAYAMAIRPTGVCAFTAGALTLWPTGVSRPAWRRLGAFAGGALVIVAGSALLERHLLLPPLAPGYRLNVTVHGLLHFTHTFPGLSIDDSMESPTWEMARRLRREIAGKVWRQIQMTPGYLAEVLPPFFGLFAVLGVTLGSRQPRLERLLVVAAMATFVIIGIMWLTHGANMRRHILFGLLLTAPVAGEGIVRTWQHAAERWGRCGRVAMILALACTLWSGASGLVNKLLVPNDRYPLAVARGLTPFLRPGDLVAARGVQGEAITWYTRRKCLPLPEDNAEAAELLARGMRATVVVLPQREPGEKTWRPIGYRPVGRFLAHWSGGDVGFAVYRPVTAGTTAPRDPAAQP